MFENHIRNSTTIATIGYFLFFLLILVLIESLLVPGLIQSSNLIHWDAKHYFLIKRDGYNPVNVAFFPLFPFLWKVLSLDGTGIALVNVAIFGTAFCFLAKMLKLSLQETVLYLTIPSNLFYFLPYTEALFFATSCLIILGYKKEKISFIALGLLLSTLVRPVFLFFFLAVIATELYGSKINRKTLLRITALLLTLSIGLSIVFGIHFYYTGNWFAYFDIINAWGGILHSPHFPFTSWSGSLILRLDGAAMFVGILAGILLISILLKATLLKVSTVSKEVIFSLTYLSGITLFIIFRGGSIFSLNRFVFAVPFIIVACNFWINLPIYIRTKHLVYLFVSITLFWLLFGSYEHIQTFLKFSLVSLYLLMLFLLKLENRSFRNIATTLFIIVNLTFQVFLYCQFLKGHWIG